MVQQSGSCRRSPAAAWVAATRQKEPVKPLSGVDANPRLKNRLTQVLPNMVIVQTSCSTAAAAAGNNPGKESPRPTTPRRPLSSGHRKLAPAAAESTCPLRSQVSCHYCAAFNTERRPLFGVGESVEAHLERTGVRGNLDRLLRSRPKEFVQWLEEELRRCRHIFRSQRSKWEEEAEALTAAEKEAAKAIAAEAAAVQAAAEEARAEAFRCEREGLRMEIEDLRCRLVVAETKRAAAETDATKAVKELKEITTPEESERPISAPPVFTQLEKDKKGRPELRHRSTLDMEMELAEALIADAEADMASAEIHHSMVHMETKRLSNSDLPE